MVKRILPAFEVDMGGIPLLQPLPTREVQQLDPFLLLHHHASEVRAGSPPLASGIGPHPHRGFTPVTFIFQGDVHHRDSRGNSQVVHAGGVQWLDVGMGIVHSERPSAALCQSGGTQEIIQLWINLPASKKWMEPKYLSAEREEMPALPGLKGDVRVVSGSMQGMQGAISGAWPVTALMGYLETGDQLTLEKGMGEMGFTYLLDGLCRVEGHGLVEGKNLVQFSPESISMVLEAKEKTRFIYLAAPGIGEPVSQYGPFVMNTQTQILEALRDAQMGKMGVLIEE